MKNNNKHEITIKIENEEWENAIDKAFDKKKNEVKIDGFRKGKVSRSVFEKKYGKESLFFDAADIIIPTAFNKVMEESDLIPVVQPQVSVKSITDKGVEFVFTIITKPVVEIKKYKGHKVTKEELKVTKEEIDHEIDHLLEKYTELEIKDGKVANKNVTIIDFEGFKDGVAFPGGKGENYSLEIGSNTFIPGFEEQLIGMELNEEKDINLEFPEDYHAEDLKGAKVVFKVKINEIKEKVQRKLDQELFEDLNMPGVTNEQELRTEIETSLKANKEMQVENKYIDELLETISKETTVEIPEEMIEEEVNRLMTRFAENIKMQGISLDMYYQFTQSTEDNLKDQLKTEANKNVLYRLMLEEIAKLENIVITDEEVNSQAEELASKYQMDKEQFLQSFGGLDMIKYDLEMKKTIEILKENN